MNITFRWSNPFLKAYRKLRSCVRPFSSIIQHVFFVLLAWFMRWEVSGHTTYLVLLTRMICRISGKLTYNCCFLGCCHQHFCQNSLKHPRLVPILLFFKCLNKDQMVQFYGIINTAIDRKKSRCSFLFFSESSRFHMVDNLSIAIIAFLMRILISFLVEVILLPRYVNSLLILETYQCMWRSCLKHINSFISVFT